MVLHCLVVAHLFSLTPKRVDIYLKNEFSTPCIFLQESLDYSISTLQSYHIQYDKTS